LARCPGAVPKKCEHRGIDHLLKIGIESPSAKVSKQRSRLSD